MRTQMRGAPFLWRAPLILLAFASLALGVCSGLARLGWAFAPSVAGLAGLHGPLMVSGFFGTVIALERAVAIGRRWSYLGPLAAGLGAALAIAGAPPTAAALLVTAGSVVLCIGSFAIFRRQRELFTLTIALGSLCWVLGNLLWLVGLPPYAPVPFWMSFLVLTIAGERLELSRLLPPSAVAKRVFACLLAVLLAGCGLSIFAWGTGTLVFAAGLLVLALWLLKQDIARRTVRAQGLTRYIAVCLLSGYFWLALGGIAVLREGGLGYGGTGYDAALHAVLLGFVFSMVFGHAPIILPAVLRVAVPYGAYFYLPLALLHASLALRIGGDCLELASWRAWGGALNGFALAAFVLGMIAAVVRAKRSAEPAPNAGRA